jgi:hypothetical protein
MALAGQEIVKYVPAAKKYTRDNIRTFRHGRETVKYGHESRGTQNQE